MMPHEALRVTRWVAGLSIATLITGAALAVFVWLLPSSSPVKISGALALVVLWVSNLISLILNAVYWFIRRWPQGLLLTLFLQAGLTLAGVLAAILFG